MAKLNPKTRIVLLDAHAIIHRAYHAMPDFTSRAGEPTGALYGVSTMLLKIAAELRPDYIFACYDLPKPTFRHVAYEHYKAGRKSADDALAVQLGTSREIFEAFSIPIYEHPGFEADDIIGTLAHLLQKKKDFEVIIASGDMDTMQLIVGDTVRVYTLKKGINDTILYNEDSVIERFGFKPKQIPDYKGLAGDSSDNIPGIKGIGPKTATTILQTFGTVEGLYKAIKKEKDKFSFQGSTPRIITLLKEGKEDAEFSKTLATIRLDAPVNFVLPTKLWLDDVDENKVQTVFTKYDFRSLKDRVSLLKERNKSIESPEKKIATKESEENMDPDTFKKLQLLTWLLQSDKTNPKREDILEVSKTDSLVSAGESLLSMLKETKTLSDLYTTVEEPLLSVVKKMSHNGITLDTAYLKTLEKKYTKDIEKLTKDIYVLAGKEFNISSPKQLSVVLFEDLNLSVKGIKKTSGGAKSTNIDTLEKLKDEHLIIPKIMEYRELDKILNTYIKLLPKFVQKDGRVHSDFIQTGAATGRFASLDPNMQNLPVSSDEGKNIRKAFVAAKGTTLVAFDYSQIELRIAAILSKDETLLDTFRAGDDVHTRVAMRVFGVDESSITKEMRRHAKTINFGILYGMGVSALKDGMGTDRKEAQEFYDTYKNSFKTLMSYLEQVKLDAKVKGYTETLYGRRRPMPLLRSPLPFLRAQGERMAINAPIQGTAADIVRFALVDVDRLLQTSGLEKDAKILLQVHDEIVLEVSNDKVKEVITLVKPILETVLEKYKNLEIESVPHVPLTVDVKKGENLGELA